MPEPMERAPHLQAGLDALMGQDIRATIRRAVCVLCGGQAQAFRDALSEKEYTKSGLCQGCQDSVFNDEEEM